MLGTIGVFFFLKSTIISWVLDAFNWRQLLSLHDTSLFTSWRYSDSSEFVTSPSNVVPPTNFTSGTEEWWQTQLFVNREYRSGEGHIPVELQCSRWQSRRLYRSFWQTGPTLKHVGINSANLHSVGRTVFTIWISWLNSVVFIFVLVFNEWVIPFNKPVHH